MCPCGINRMSRITDKRRINGGVYIPAEAACTFTARRKTAFSAAGSRKDRSRSFLVQGPRADAGSTHLRPGRGRVDSAVKAADGQGASGRDLPPDETSGESDHRPRPSAGPDQDRRHSADDRGIGAGAEDQRAGPHRPPARAPCGSRRVRGRSCVCRVLGDAPPVATTANQLPLPLRYDASTARRAG